MQKNAKKRVIFVFRRYECKKLQNEILKSINIYLGTTLHKKFSWCSGYHICLTHRRSPVLSRAKTYFFLFVTSYHMKNSRAMMHYLCPLFRFCIDIFKFSNGQYQSLKLSIVYSLPETLVKVMYKYKLIPDTGPLL